MSNSTVVAVDQCNIIKSFSGDNLGEFYGCSVANAGDVNNDGINDIVVGASLYSGVAEFAGRAVVYSGKNGEVLHSFLGGHEHGTFGSSVSSGGDVNNDGFDDILVGAPNGYIFDSGPGRVYVFSGYDGSLLYAFVGEAANNFFGLSVAPAGDIDNDGFDDFAVGAFGYDEFKGRVYLYSGSTGDTIFTVTGDAAFDRLGFSVAGIGDLNGDGIEDIIAGAPGWDNHTGKVFAFSGSGNEIIYSFFSESDYMGFGGSVAGAGDVNNDGVDDIMIGDQYFGSYHGRAYLYSGIDGSLLYTFAPEFTSSFGFSVASAGDVNNDGYGDLVIGAYYEFILPGTSNGSVYIYSGMDGDLLNKFWGGEVSNFFGISVAAAGDINGDGFDDIIIGERTSNPNNNQNGKVYLLSFELCVGNRGDINHDGNDADILDLTFLIDRIFRSGQISDCPEEADVNTDGASANILDLTFLVDHIFRGGQAPGPCY